MLLLSGPNKRMGVLACEVGDGAGEQESGVTFCTGEPKSGKWKRGAIPVCAKLALSACPRGVVMTK